MITSFLVYPFMIFSMFMLFRVPVNCYNGRLLKARTNMMYWFHVAIGIFIFIFFTGVRWDVGIDQLSYWQIYNTLSLTDTFIRDDMVQWSKTTACIVCFFMYLFFLLIGEKGRSYSYFYIFVDVFSS